MAQFSGDAGFVFDAPVFLADLEGPDGFRLRGIDAGDRSGAAVSAAGDVDGDGQGDLIIGAPGASPGGREGAGESYVVFGRALGFPKKLDLSDLDGTDGFRIVGIDAGDQSGEAVSGAGDVDGDGFADLIIGAPGASPGNRDGAGESYVVFGQPGGFPGRLDLADLDGTDGFRIVGIDQGDQSGTAVRGAGDIDGDGFDDLIVGAPGADPGGRQDAGETYVVFGRATGIPKRLNLADLDGVEGFRIVGIDADDRSGTAVGGAGDVDRDGFEDLIIGAPDASPEGRDAAGETYVVFGKAVAPERLHLSDLDGTNGFRIRGIDQDDRAGQAVGGAGDVDGDRFDDLIIGAPGASPGGRAGAGESYVVLGGRGDFPERLSLAGLDGVNGFRIVGISSGDQSGQAVGGAGDVDGDGFDDVVVGAPGASTDDRDQAGESYLIFGRRGVAKRVTLSDLDGAGGVAIVGVDEDDRSGEAVSGAGDIDGDGLDDLVIGAPGATPGGRDDAGETFVLFGDR